MYSIPRTPSLAGCGVGPGGLIYIYIYIYMLLTRKEINEFGFSVE